MPQPSGWGLFLDAVKSMTPANSLCLILRRLDEVESKLDRMLQGYA